jgi:5-methylthioadenosine/S-adenosylhomocysteine deaminase
MEPQTVELLIHAKWVAPVVPEEAVYTDCAVAVDRGKILGLHPSGEARRRYRPHREVVLDRHILIPGLVNAHGHTPMTLLRGYADDLPLQRWLEEHIWPAEGRWVGEDFVRDGAELALAEMLKTGTTCFADMYFFPDLVAKLAWQHGVRCQVAFPVIDMASAWARGIDEYIHKGLTLFDTFKDHEMVTVAFGPHAPYTVDDATLDKIAVLASEVEAGIQIHLHETAGEVRDALSATGQRPIERLRDHGLLTPATQCVHMTQANDTDLALLAESGAHVIHCPRSNLKLASGFCPVHLLQEAGINVALGTDGAASNNNLDMLEELQFSALLAKGVSGEPTALPAARALRMATLDGARALGLDAVTGSLEAGKSADLAAVDLGDIGCQPMYNPLSQLIYSHGSNGVSHVWVNGKSLLEDRALQTFNEHELMAKARQWQQRIAGQGI